MKKFLSFFDVQTRCSNMAGYILTRKDILLDESHPPPEIVDFALDEINALKPLFCQSTWKLILEKSKFE